MAAVLLVAVPFLGAWGKGGRPEPLRGWSLGGVDVTGAACFRDPDGHTRVPDARGKRLVVTDGECRSSLKPGAPPKFTLVLKSATRKAVIPVDAGGEFLFHMTQSDDEDARVQRVVKIMLRGAARRLVLIDDRGRETVLARFQPGIVQSIDGSIVHDPDAPGGVVVSNIYAFYGTGMCRGDGERSFAVHSRTRGKGGIVLSARSYGEGDTGAGDDELSPF